MRRFLAIAVLGIATLAAGPAAAWDRHGPGWGWRPTPAWQYPYRHHGWHAPRWQHRRAWREHRRHEAWRHGWRGDDRSWRHYDRRW